VSHVLVAIACLWIGYRIALRRNTYGAHVRGWMAGFEQGVDSGAQRAEEFVVRQRENAPWQ
jgi:hypothetical protein